MHGDRHAPKCGARDDIKTVIASGLNRVKVSQ